MRKAFRYILPLVFAFVLAVLSSFIRVYTGPDDPAVGAKVYLGLPIPFKVCAPGWSWCSWSWWFVADLLIIFLGLTYLSFRFQETKSRHNKN